MTELEDEDDLLSSLLNVAEAELNSLNGIQHTPTENVTQKNAPHTCKDTGETLLSDVDKFTTNISSQQSVLHKRKKFEGIGKALNSFYDEGIDSSDEEGNRNYEKQKYNEYGREIKELLLHSDNSSNQISKSSGSTESTRSKDWKAINIKGKAFTSAKTKLSSLEFKKPTANVYTDPIFGISIINPAISSKVLQERMIARKVVPICQINKHLKTLKKDEDWVIAGVICSKGLTKTSANGNQYIIWTLSDLLGDIKTIALFLFGSAYKQYWKTQPGYVVGILNPAILDKREGSRDEAILSIDNAQKILILGQSKDLGTCKSTKNNGEKCTAIVNKSKCEVCIYHIKQEYQKCSKRSELQANFSGKGLIALRNRVLGKNEVFYAGKSYTAIPSKKSKRLTKKDTDRLQSLNGVVNINPNRNLKKTSPLHKAAASFDVVRSQRIKDIETLRKLGVNTEKYGSSGALEDFKACHSSPVSLNESKANALNVLSKLNAKKTEKNETLNIIKNSNGKYTDPELQKSLDEIVNNDFVDLNVYHERSKKQLDTSDNKDRNHFTVKSSAKSGSTCDKEKKNSRVPTSITRVEENQKMNEPSVIYHSLSAEKTKCSSDSEFEIKTNALDLPSNEKVEVKNIDKSKCTDLVFSQSLIMSAVPTLSKNDYIDLNQPTIARQSHSAKLKALQIIKKSGPLTKSDPNNIKGRRLKRNLDALEVPTDSQIGKKLKSIKENEFLSDRFKKMMELQSKHLDLIEIRDNEEKQKYFKKLEVKEQLEEKMANTYKIECKAVRCLTCKYTSFSAADKCKKEKHRLRVFDALKRFFKCGHCGNRVACLDVVPIHTCKNCGSSHWERTTMIKEKRILNTVSLSIRGGEQQYISSTVTDANINLLVPDED